MLSKYKEAPRYEVESWLEEQLQLTKEQSRRMRDFEIVRFSKYKFMKKRTEKNESLLMRLTVPLWFVTFLILWVGLPFNFIITGEWGYDDNKINWFARWTKAVSLRI